MKASRDGSARAAGQIYIVGMTPWTADEDTPLTFCDQCGWLQPGPAAACARCWVPLDRSVYDPFVAISQNAALVRQAIQGRAKPSGFGRFALISLGLLYLIYSALFLHSLLSQPFSIVALVFVLLDLVIGLLILSAFHRMGSRDTWDEYRRWS
ncbi:hypothetical protein BH20GEM1_BH20GEM1_11720 [soil metagenome]